MLFVFQVYVSISISEDANIPSTRVGFNSGRCPCRVWTPNSVFYVLQDFGLTSVLTAYIFGI